MVETKWTEGPCAGPPIDEPVATQVPERLQIADAVRVTGADYNGALPWETAWDGCPFSSTPGWLIEAITSGLLSPDTPGHTDYAEWCIRDSRGDAMWATPGDWIARTSGGALFVVKPFGWNYKARRSDTKETTDG